MPAESQSEHHNTTVDVLCAVCLLLPTHTRLNSAEEADDAQLQKQLLQLVQELTAVNPTPRPAESDRINGRCASHRIEPDTRQMGCNSARLSVSGVSTQPTPLTNSRPSHRWALLYTLPDAAKGDVRRDFLNTILAELYDFFYK